MHFPSDDGAITGTWLSVGQKTTKAYCGKRVALSKLAFNSRITCAACRDSLNKRVLSCENVIEIAQTDKLMQSLSSTQSLVAVSHKTIAFIRAQLAR